MTDKKQKHLMLQLCGEYQQTSDRPNKKYFLIASKKFGKNGPTNSDYQCFNRYWNKYRTTGPEHIFKRNTRYPTEEEKLINYINVRKNNSGCMPTLKEMRNHLLEETVNKNFKASYEFLTNVLKKKYGLA